VGGLAILGGQGALQEVEPPGLALQEAIGPPVDDLRTVGVVGHQARVLQLLEAGEQGGEAGPVCAAVQVALGGLELGEGGGQRQDAVEGCGLHFFLRW
jgi:hypothetical protein